MKTMNMQAIALALNRLRPLGTVRVLGLGVGIGVGLLMGSCSAQPVPPTRHIQLQQTWELQPGDQIGGHLVAASLGDVSLDLDGGSVYAPFDGQLEPLEDPHCVIFSTAEVPAYLFRLCGLGRPQLGAVRQGRVIGRGQHLHFGTLRMQPDGTWALVEPARTVLARLLNPEAEIEPEVEPEVEVEAPP
jgi:hypothetical protein